MKTQFDLSAEYGYDHDVEVTAVAKTSNPAYVLVQLPEGYTPSVDTQGDVLVCSTDFLSLSKDDIDALPMWSDDQRDFFSIFIQDNEPVPGQLPHPSELTNTQALLVVDSYDEYADMFDCTMHTAAPCEGQPFKIPAMLLPMLTHEYDDPHETCGRTFLVERGAKKADYQRLQRVLVTVAQDFEDVLSGGRADRNAELVYNAANEANRIEAQL